MLLCSLKVKKHTVTLVSLICAAVFVFVCFFALRLSSADTITVGDKTVTLTAESEEDIGEFISALGYEADELISKREVVIPSQWNELYTSYAQTQKEQGFDLSKIIGKDAKEYTYSLKDSELFAVILVCDSRIAAAHLSRLDGSAEIEELL